MGLLDDAIREHLDLKRRRGADPLEVERAEREALGPVRRAPEGQPEPELPSESEFAADEDLAGEPLAGEHVAHEYAHDEYAHHERVDDERVDDEHLAGDSWSHDVAQAPAERDDEFEPQDHDESEPAADAAPPHRAPQETAEFDIEEALEHEPEHQQPGDDDVLEETPEFLQDTPDHDRLWFEQRPPKDFDFDR